MPPHTSPILHSRPRWALKGSEGVYLPFDGSAETGRDVVGAIIESGLPVVVGPVGGGVHVGRLRGLRLLLLRVLDLDTVAGRVEYFLGWLFALECRQRVLHDH